MRTSAFCEIDPFCQAVLRKHWPDVPIYDDIRTLPAIAADVVCAGFPCQPGSSAARGRDLGRDHPQWLWPEVPRVVQASGAAWFIGENVAHLDKRTWGALDQVVSDLEAIGFQVAPPFEIPACAFRHDHWRPRLWVLGYSDSNRKPVMPVHAEVAGLPRGGPYARGSRAPDGIPGRLDINRRTALGNSLIPQIPEAIGRAIMKANALAA